MNKKGPKEDLIPGQENNINLMFYRDFMIEYFDIKATNLVSLITNAKEYADSIGDKYFKIGKLEFIEEIPTEENIIKYSKSEVVSTYYHCIETFMRLFISHALLTECPLIELSSMEPKKYRKKIKKIAQGKFDFLNNKLSGDETILSVLTGFSNFEKCPITKTEFNNLKKWIIFCASELINMSEYNSFKHGLNMFIGKGALKINNNVGDILSKEGDIVYFLESVEKEKRYEFAISNIFVEYDFKIILIKFVNELIRNIIIIGNMFYVTKKSTKIPGMHFTLMNYDELRDQFYEKKDLGVLMSSYKLELHYSTDELNEFE